MVSKSMLASLLQNQLSYTPRLQPYHVFDGNTWHPSTNRLVSDPTRLANCPESNRGMTKLHLITWNIDFMASHPRARMAAALAHLEQIVSGIEAESAIVIFLQEMVEQEGEDLQDAKDLSMITEQHWVRRKFNVTNIDSKGWISPYGVTTLVDRRLDITEVARLHFVSEYRRDMLMVDIRLANESGGVVRLCNVHLDSAYGSMRPVQWKALAHQIQRSVSVAAGIVAGDCNATQPRDRTEPQENGFKDAYLELGGTESDDEGATWGLQSTNNRWGRQRLDKVVFAGNVGITGLRKIGVGVEVEDLAAKQDLGSEGELGYATDHYGLMAEFRVKDGLRTAQ